VAEEAKTNLMVQNLKVNQRDPPKLHKPMVKCLNKYGISFKTVHPSKAILRELPLWHHPGEDSQKRQENNGKKAKCLRKKHAILNIGDGLDLAQRLEDPLHYKRASCMCNDCDDDRTIRGCENPHACAAAAASRLGQILPKLIPKPSEPEEPIPTAATMDREDNTAFFRPSKSITEIAQGLRVMTLRGGEPKERPNMPVRRRAAVTPAPAATEVYIAGVVHAPSSKTACAAAGVFIKDEDSRNKGKCIPVVGEQSQYAAEFFAALEAVRSTSRDRTLTITSTQTYIRDAMNKKLSGWEHEGWVGVPHREVLRCLAA
jgi:hypothetical protein